jgi:hypothetical protein
LLIVNFLNQAGTTEVAKLTGSGEGEGGRYYYDTNGDGTISPMDALNVINYLNTPTSGSEGESGIDLIDAGITAPVTVQATDNRAFAALTALQTSEPSDPATNGSVNRPAWFPEADENGSPAERYDVFDSSDVADELVERELVLSDDMAEDIYAAWADQGSAGDRLAELL